MRNSFLHLIVLVLAAFAATAGFALGDEVVLTSGERFTSSRIWEENGKIRFDLQGLIVSVNIADVASIDRSTDRSMPSAPPPETSYLPRPTAALAKPVPPLPDKQAAQAMPEEPTKQAPPEPGPKARGIGIDGLTWQMKPSEIKGIEKLEPDPSFGGIDQYGWQAGNLTLGDALLDGLVFGFWQNRLYSIMLWVDGKPGYARLQEAVFDRYGTGTKSEKGLERYIWSDDTTDRLLEFDTKLNTGIFWMRSKRLDQKVKRLYPQ